MAKIKWACKSCEDILTSDTEEHHKLDWCKCGKSYVDAEEFYIRVGGYAELLDERHLKKYQTK